MLLDLDRFKDINDSLGHYHGDLLLQQIGPRLQKLLRETDSIARLGGDEFAILMVNVPAPAAAVHVADKVREEMKRPFPVKGITLHIDASIGIGIYPPWQDGRSAVAKSGRRHVHGKGQRSGR
jgi:diguanylate cyclase (GGDEF)-like protein